MATSNWVKREAPIAMLWRSTHLPAVSLIKATEIQSRYSLQRRFMWHAENENDGFREWAIPLIKDTPPMDDKYLGSDPRTDTIVLDHPRTDRKLPGPP